MDTQALGCLTGADLNPTNLGLTLQCGHTQTGSPALIYDSALAILPSGSDAMMIAAAKDLHRDYSEATV